MHDIFKAYRGFTNQGLLTEALEDLGLSDKIVNYIRNSFDDRVSEKALTWYGSLLKKDQNMPVNAADAIKTVRYLQKSLSEEELDLDDAEAKGLLDDLDEYERQKDKYILYYQEAVNNFRAKPTYRNAKSVLKTLKSIRKAYAKKGYVFKTNDTKLLELYNAIKANSPNKRTEPVTRFDVMMAMAERDILLGPMISTVQGSYQPISSLLAVDDSYLGMLNAATTIWDANRLANEVYDKLERDELIEHKFDDGYYWYNLDTRTCAVEGDRMGHCGSDGRGTLYSLRKKEPGKKESKSYVTVAYNAYPDKTVYQIKGQSNTAPSEDLWPYIIWFIDEYGVEAVEESGEHSDDDFAPMLAAIDESTEATVKDSVAEVEARVEQIVTDANNTMQPHVEVSADVEHIDVDGYYISYGATFGPFTIYLKPSEVVEMENSAFEDYIDDYFDKAVSNSDIGYGWDRVSSAWTSVASSTDPHNEWKSSLERQAGLISSTIETSKKIKDYIKVDANGNVPVSFIINFDGTSSGKHEQTPDIDGLESFVYELTAFASSYSEIVDQIQHEMYNDGSAKIAGAFTDLLNDISNFNEETLWTELIYSYCPRTAAQKKVWYGKTYMVLCLIRMHILVSTTGPPSPERCASEKCAPRMWTARRKNGYRKVYRNS